MLLPGIKKREMDSKSPASSKRDVCFGPGRILSKSQDNLKAPNPPRKIRRAMTFGGAAAADDTPFADCDPFAVPEPLLPSFLEPGKDMIRRITLETVGWSDDLPQLTQVLRGDYNTKIDDFHLIDCRYPFEYQGGHISSAVNITSTSEIERLYFSKPATSRKCAIVFHCEYSIQRAPQMYSSGTHLRALFFRGLDRNANKDNYPHLHYPDIYILQGGYHSFFGTHKVTGPSSPQMLCNPQAYIEMNDPRFEQECKMGILLQKKQFPKASDGFLR
ncbi:cell division cycle- protein [Kappamyces sp. JEL0829]|nr:cell division cycle- protein [Kappamyces sp. JEL0829]